ncbi:hypothetical protein MAM1_0102c05284 [Mucor ambiguus]|uniref:Uncharacterized protein n=1 Tax=Mucor ambiguus TaxID=91626 RepID=A0A0C9MEV2_9FUNG|nr:hypothetical protein MAM1_0102c05284 [Mucor ambiguus]
MHCLQFQGFLKDDARFLKFTLAMNDNVLMGDIKSDPNAKISWTMSKTKEYYIFKGKFYIASSPIQVTRFPPPKIIDDETTSASDYWEDQRIQQWNELDAESRATFTWPSRAETPKAADIAFSCQSLSTKDKTLVHDIAMDNFCLLVYKVTDVEHFDYSVFPPKRLNERRLAVFIVWVLRLDHFSAVPSGRVKTFRDMSLV